MTRSIILATRGRLAAGLWAALAGAAGCGGPKPAGTAELPAPMVTVAPPVERLVTRYESATGRAEAIEQVEVRARVSGYLKKVAFEPGRELARGAPLIEIDPDPYQAELERTTASQETAEAELLTAEAERGRAEARMITTKQEYSRREQAFQSGSGSESERDRAKGEFDEASATVRAAAAKVRLSRAKIDEAKAAVKTARLNRGYCDITAPIAGEVGDRLVTEGNLVTGGVGNTTLLTTIVAVEKMDVAFDVDEITLLRIQQAVREGKIKAPAMGEIPAEAGVAIHGTAYPLKGKINFADNRVDPKTGTVRMKARFDNPKPPTGDRLLTAGNYARVRVPLGEPVRSMLVPEAALGSDQGIRFLYLVGPDNKAVRADAVVGNPDGDLRVVESVRPAGEAAPRPLRADDRVIVSGLQRVRPGLTVDPKPAK